MPRGTTNSPVIPYSFNPLFCVGDRVADNQPYKALEGLAKAAHTWSQLKRNVQPRQGRELLLELASRNSDLANSLKSGLTKSTLRFYDHVGNPHITALSDSQRMNVTAFSRPKRLSKTRKSEKLILEDPLSVKIFRKIIDRNSGKPLFKIAKIVIAQTTDNTYIADKGKVHRKNHISLKPNFDAREFSATSGTIGERSQRRFAPNRFKCRSKQICSKQENSQKKIKFDLINMQINHR